MDNNGVAVGNGVCHKGTVNGGHDVWSSQNGNSSSSADHLVVMVHGILGRLETHKSLIFCLFDLIWLMGPALIQLGLTFFVKKRRL